MKQTLNEYLAAREALFRNPSDERARAWWTSEGYAPPMHPTVPLATVHKARLQWLDATDDMLAESRAFLFDYGYQGVPNIRALHVKDPGRRAGETRPCPAQGPRMSYPPTASTTAASTLASPKVSRAPASARPPASRPNQRPRYQLEVKK